MSYKELKDIYKQCKPRDRTRSTVFEDDVEKSEKRQQRRLSERREIESAIGEENDINTEINWEDFNA